MNRRSLWILTATAFAIAFVPLALLFVQKRWLTPVPAVVGPYLPDAQGKPTLGVLPDFALTNEQGRVVGWKDYEGRIVVVDFVFTRCASICPKMSGSMKKIQDATKDLADEVSLLSHSIDPEIDSIPVLSNYAVGYGALPNRWHFVTGSPSNMAALATDFYKIPVGAKDQETGQILHGPQLVLVDSKRRIRGWYDGTSPQAVENLLRDLRALARSERL